MWQYVKMSGMELTPEQMKKLVELAYLGEWMINSRHGVDIQDEEASDSLQKLLSLAVPYVEGIERDVESGNYYLNNDWAEEIDDVYVADYDDHVFWDELVERLAERDLANHEGIEIEDVDREDYLSQLRPLESRYIDEFDEHGIERLVIE
jgi:hypothetical protein